MLPDLVKNHKSSSLADEFATLKNVVKFTSAQNLVVCNPYLVNLVILAVGMQKLSDFSTSRKPFI